MQDNTIDRTRRLGGIIKEMCKSHPDDKTIALLIMQEAGLEDLGQVLQQRRQDWRAISSAMQTYISYDPSFQRCIKILETVRKHPCLTYDELSIAANYDRVTIQHTLNALKKGGVDIQSKPGDRANGRPKVRHWLKTNRSLAINRN